MGGRPHPHLPRQPAARRGVGELVPLAGRLPATPTNLPPLSAAERRRHAASARAREDQSATARPADSAGLWEQLADGRIDLATSDHAPWKPEKKNKPDIFDNASGTPGVETLLPLIYSEGVAKGRLSLARLVSVLCERPAELFGLAGRKGRLAPGADADFVVLDPEARWTLSANLLRSVAGWTPYEGLPMHGRVTHTYVRGQPVVVEGDLVGGRPGVFQPPVAGRTASAVAAR